MAAVSGKIWYMSKDDVVSEVFLQENKALEALAKNTENGIREDLKEGIYSTLPCHKATMSWGICTSSMSLPEGTKPGVDYQKVKFSQDDVLYYIYREVISGDDDYESEYGDNMPGAPRDGDDALINGQALLHIDPDNFSDLASSWSEAMGRHLKECYGLNSQGLGGSISSEIGDVLDMLASRDEICLHPGREKKALVIRNHLCVYPSVKGRIEEVEESLKDLPNVAVFYGCRPETTREDRTGDTVEIRSEIIEIQQKYFGPYPKESHGFFINKIPMKFNQPGWKDVYPLTHIRAATLGIAHANLRPDIEPKIMKMIGQLFYAAVPMDIRGIPTFKKLEKLYPKFSESSPINDGRWNVTYEKDTHCLDFKVHGKKEDDVDACVSGIRKKLEDRISHVAVGDIISGVKVDLKHIEAVTRDDGYFSVAISEGKGPRAFKRWSPGITKNEGTSFVWNDSISVKKWILSGLYEGIQYNVMKLPSSARHGGTDKMDVVREWSDTASHHSGFHNF